MYTYIYIHTHTHKCIYTYIYTHTRAHTHTHTCVCARSDGGKITKQKYHQPRKHTKKLQDNSRVSEYNDECKDVRELDTLDENTKVIIKK